MLVLSQLLPNWDTLDIHESSPSTRGVSSRLAGQAPGYVATSFWPHVPLGTQYNGTRCENLEVQTFESETFDLVVTQDVMEHVFRPDLVYQEIHRTLRQGGFYIHTAPINKYIVQTEPRATLNSDGQISYLAEPEFHINPNSDQGSLVTFHYGYDLIELISEWTPFDVEIRRFSDRTHGIVAEYTDVIICMRRR